MKTIWFILTHWKMSVGFLRLGREAVRAHEDGKLGDLEQSALMKRWVAVVHHAKRKRRTAGDIIAEKAKRE